ncbi:MAG: thioredoxin domain-containing protein [Candidatus Dormibacteria bacterium]
MNRLASETSPYLLQHRDNPVDWYPWGTEALERAAKLDRPILLSIGYSACHWCHVMERESFEDAATAALMNEHFVCIKVDREERPDLDSIYMSAVQQLTGSGGWPMTVFLTPALKPFFGGTYFPPAPRYGMPGFPQVLEAVNQAYMERREEVEATADQLTESISGELSGARDATIDRGILERAVEGLRRAFDPAEGGFGAAPKFPQAMAIEFLLRTHAGSGDADVLHIARTSLQRMLRGGIYDQLGGGFHRYSTDAEWLVPHFEKMLYDQALLAPAYLHAFQLTGDPELRSGATGIIDYVLQDLTSEEGGFFCAEDADSEGVEGLYYTWSWDELTQACGGDLDLVAAAYGARPAGNWEGRNILHVVETPGTVGERLGLGPGEAAARLAAVGERLLALRGERVRPARDEKILTAWNGLMLAAVAEAAAVLDRGDYLVAAQRNASLLLDRLYVGGRVLRTYRDGDARLNGYLEDYACLAHGLLALYQCDFNPRWFTAAVEIAGLMLERFRDPAGGIFFSTVVDQDGLLYRPKDFDDNAVPAGNSVAAEVLLQLALFTGEDRYRAQAEALLTSLGPSMASHPLFFGRLLGVLAMHLGNPVEVAVVGDLDGGEGRDMLRALRAPYLPNKVVAGGQPGAVTPTLLRDRNAQGAAVATYVCRDFTCARPVTDPVDLAPALGSPGLPPEGFLSL